MGRAGGIGVGLGKLGVSVDWDEGEAGINFIVTILGGVFSRVAPSHCQDEKTAMSPTCRHREPAMARFPKVLPGNLDVENEFIFKGWEEANLLPYLF